MNWLQLLIKYFTVILVAAVKYLTLVILLKLSVELAHGSLTTNNACGIIMVGGIFLELCITIFKSIYIKCNKED